jgi:trans-2-enoyl-CoA reductase
LLPPEPITLALDSVFGKVGQLLAAALAPKGKFVMVGLLAGAKASLNLTTEHLFTRQLSFLPFRGSEVLKRMGDQRAQEVIDEIVGMFVDGTLKRPDVKVVDWGKAGKGEVEVEDALGTAVHAAEGVEVGHVKTVWKLT